MFIAACVLMVAVFMLVVALLLWVNKNNISVEYKKVTLDNTKALPAKTPTKYKTQPTIDNNEILLLLKKYPDLQVFYDRGYRFESLNPLVMVASDALCFD